MCKIYYYFIIFIVSSLCWLKIQAIQVYRGHYEFKEKFTLLKAVYYYGYFFAHLLQVMSDLGSQKEKFLMAIDDDVSYKIQKQ